MLDFNYYILQGEPSQREKAEAWAVAIGLQDVDGLHVSQCLLQNAQEHVEGKVSLDEVEKRIVAYYQTEAGRKEESGTDEADSASARITRLLADNSFVFSPAAYATIHGNIFSGILPHAGRYRTYNMTKKEWVLDGASVAYAPCDWIAQSLEYDFVQEKQFSYSRLQMPAVVAHFANFISNIWQIHPFEEGNTRATAVFAIKYLRHLGFEVNNSPFKQHSWYFRNALVRANYENIPKGIERTSEFLELFFRNILMGENNVLKNRFLHVLWQGERPRLMNSDMSLAPLDGSEKMAKGSEKSSEKIVRLMREMPLITAQDLAEEIGISRRAVEKSIVKLKASGRIRRVGPDKGGHWKVL